MDGYCFACGDGKNPGRLYVTNPNDPDSTRATSWIEITSPTEPLMNGCMYNGQAFVWSSERFFAIQPDPTQEPPFRALEVPNGKGLLARWAFAVGPSIWFLAKDGMYETEGGMPRNISDVDLAPIFPHEGDRGLSENNFVVPDFTTTAAGGILNSPTKHRLAYGDGLLYYDFPDLLSGVNATLVYNTVTRGWWPDVYAPDVVCHYLEEGLNVHSVLLGGNDVTTAKLYQFAQSADDAGVAIPCQIRTRSEDFGDDRSEKLFTEYMLDLIGAHPTGASINFTVTPGFNNHLTTLAADTVTPGATRTQIPKDINTGAGQLAKNMSLNIAWNVPVAFSTFTPELFAWDISYEPRAEDVQLRPITDWNDLGSPVHKYIWACAIDCDTLDASKTVYIQADGTQGRQVIGVPINTTAPAIVGAPGLKTITPNAAVAGGNTGMANIFVGLKVRISGGPGATEDVTVATVLSDGTGFTCTTANDHSGGTVTIVATPGQSIRRLVHLSWAALQAKQVRIVGYDTTPWEVFGVHWFWTDETPQVGNWSQYWENPTLLGDTLVYGVEIEGDTFNAAKLVSVQRDGGVAVVTNQSITLNGHDKVRLTWTAVEARTLRLISTDNVLGYLYKAVWLKHDEPPNIAGWEVNYLESGFGDKWFSGLYIECDTGANTKTVAVTVDGVAVAGSPFSVAQNGRGVKRINFTQPLRGAVATFRATDANNGRLYNWKWIVEDEPALLANWATNYTNLGSLRDKYFTGIWIDADTLGVSKTVVIEIDGVTAATLAVNHNGRRNNIYDFAVQKGREVRIAPSDANPGRLYGYEFKWVNEPPSIAQWDTNWQAPVPGQDVMSIGVEIECDTGNAAKLVTITKDGGVSVAANQSITADGRDKVRVMWAQTQARTLRLVSSAVVGRLYNITWLYLPEPAALSRWETLEMTFGVRGYWHLRESWIALRSMASVTMTITVDGASTPYVLASTAGARRKLRNVLAAKKGKVYQFVFTSTAPFRLYNDDCEVFGKSWGEDGPYQPLKPFAYLDTPGAVM
jgi:phenolic acid decarboxylase